MVTGMEFGTLGPPMMHRGGAVAMLPAGGQRVVLAALLVSARSVPVAPPGRYGWERIVAGARFLDHLDPGWWREGAWLPASLTALDMADPYRCVLAWWAAQHLPAPLRRGPRQVPPYDRAMLALCLSSRQSQALGFNGTDADLLTPGWRYLITYLRESHGRQ
jgi:hypothetical protein